MRASPGAGRLHEARAGSDDAFLLEPLSRRIGRVRTHTLALGCMTAGYFGSKWYLHNEVSDGMGGTFQMTGTRVSYFDIDKFSKDIVDAGIAYDTIYDAEVLRGLVDTSAEIERMRPVSE